jgi:hypothetical protein
MVGGVAPTTRAVRIILCAATLHLHLCNWVRACRLVAQTAGPFSSLSLPLWLAASALAVSVLFRLGQVLNV